MKQIVLSIAILSLFIGFNISNLTAATSKGDTLIIEGAGGGDAPLNEVIAGDTLEDGSRKHKVYELKRDGWYTLMGSINAGNFNLTIVGEKGSGRRPILVMGVTETGGAAGWQFFNGGANVTLKSLWFQQMTAIDEGRGAWNHIGGFVNGADARFIMDDCIVDYNDGSFIMSTSAAGQDYFFTNNLFRWNGPPDNSRWSGFNIIFKQVDKDTVLYRNCTWIGGTGPIVIWESSKINFFKMDHCTIVDHCQFPFRMEYHTHSEFTNNLFVNIHAAGEDSTIRKGQDPDRLPYGVINVDTLGTDSSFVGWPSESERVLVVSNVNNYVSPAIKTWWEEAKVTYAANDFQVADPTKDDGLLNDRARAMFDNDATWPGFELSSISSLDPQFVNYPDMSDSLIKWAKYRQEYALDQNTTEPKSHFNTDPDPTSLRPTAADYYDLRYNNSALLHAGSDGLPLGDLNWFPEITGIEDRYDTKPDVFTLKQNYPNPFNPNTWIKFNLNKPVHVELSIYNVLGQKIRTLMDKNMQAGSHSIHWNGLDNRERALPSGLYFYRIKAGNKTDSRKMILIK